MDLLVDTSDELEERPREVRRRRSQELLRKNEKLHAPPILDFVWAEQVFHGVLQSLEVTYLLFHTDGKPLRAKLGVKLKEYRPVEVQVQARPKQHLARRREALRRARRRDAELDLRQRSSATPRCGARSPWPTASPTRARSRPAPC